MSQKATIAARLVAALIGVYQKTLSLDHGWFSVFYPNGYCRFHPTCSEYGKQAVLRHGFWRGGYLALRRISRCHPWSRGGVDPVP